MALVTVLIGNYMFESELPVTRENQTLGYKKCKKTTTTNKTKQTATTKY